MKKTIIYSLLTLSIFILSFTVFADTNLIENIAEAKQNIIGQKIPSPYSIFVGDEKVALKIDDLHLGIIIKDNKVTDILLEEISKPSVTIYTNQATIESISNSEDQSAAAKKALKDGKITYQAFGFWNKIKFGVAAKFLGIGKYSGGLTGAVTKKEVTEIVDKVTDSANKVVETVKDVKEVAKDTKEVVDEIKDALKDEPKQKKQEPIIEEVKSKTHEIKLTNDGFSAAEIKIKVGDTVVWKNERSGSLKRGMIVGTMRCVRVRSSFINPGEQYQHTFEKADTCTIVDGMMTTKTMKVVIT